MIELLWKTSWQFLLNLDIHLPYEFVISFLDIREMNAYIYTKLECYVYSRYTDNKNINK